MGEQNTKEELLMKGGTELIAKCLQSGTPVQQEQAAALMQSVVDAGLHAHKVLRESGCIEELLHVFKQAVWVGTVDNVDRMDRSRDHTDTVERCVATVATIVSVDMEAKNIVRTSGGIHAIVDLLKIGGELEREQAAHALSKLAAGSEANREAIRKDGACELLEK